MKMRFQKCLHCKQIWNIVKFKRKYLNKRLYYSALTNKNWYTHKNIKHTSELHTKCDLWKKARINKQCREVGTWQQGAAKGREAGDVESWGEMDGWKNMWMDWGKNRIRKKKKDQHIFHITFWNMRGKWQMHARIFQTKKGKSFQPILCETQNEIFGIIKVDAENTAMQKKKNNSHK